MNDVLTRAACDFEDDTRHRQDIVKDIENDIAIADCRRRVLAVIGHLLRTFNLALAPLTRRVFVAEFLAIRFEASTARHHCHNTDLSGRNENAGFDRPRLHLAMN
jgi:hypothetical protein